MNIQTADLCDTHEDGLAVVAPMFASYGGRPSFGGPIATLKIFEDNSFVRKAVESPGNGRVLVIDGGASMRCALVGDQLAELAVKNGWAGLVVNGCVRDAVELLDCAVGIWAIATHPRRSDRQGIGQRDIPVDMAGVVVRPGDWCYADADGILVSDNKLA